MSNNDIVINSPIVSRSHADICCNDDGTYVITDHSTNGTIVNGISLNHNSMPVRFGDVVMLSGKIPLDWNRVNAVNQSGTSYSGAYGNSGGTQSSSSNSSIGLCIVSFLVPIVGIILYFAKKDKNRAAASTYIKWALAGFVFNLFMSILMSL